MHKRWNAVMMNAASLLKKRKRFLKTGAAAAVLVLLFILSGCAGIPERAESVSNVQLLPSGAKVIIYASIEENRELIEPAMDILGSELPEDLREEFLDRTDSIWAGIVPVSSAEPENAEIIQEPGFSMVASGDYPSSTIGFSLGISPDWKQNKLKSDTGSSAFSYWQSKHTAQQISIPEKSLILASSGKISEMADSWSNGGSVPGYGWLEAETSSDVVIQTGGMLPEEYAVFIPEFKKLPIETVQLRLKRSGDEYLISGSFYMNSEVNAFLFSVMMRASVIASKNPDGSRMFENPREIEIVKDGAAVKLKGMKLPVSVLVDTGKNWIGVMQWPQE